MSPADRTYPLTRNHYTNNLPGVCLVFQRKPVDPKQDNEVTMSLFEELSKIWLTGIRGSECKEVRVSQAMTSLPWCASLVGVLFMFGVST